MRTYEALSEAVVLEGIERFFGLMTNENVVLVNHLAKLGMPMVRPRTEGGVIGMADGFARASGLPQLAIVGAGPGATPTATAMMTARKRRSPLVLIAGGQRPGAHPRKEMDLRAFYETTAGHYSVVDDVESLGDCLHEAFHRVRSGQGPAVIVCPSHILDAPVPADWDYVAADVPVHAPTADMRDLERAAEILAGASRPVVIAGRGAVSPSVSALLQELGERIGALMATTIQAQGLFATNPFDLGHIGTLGSPLGQEVLADADCVLAVGSSLDSFMTDSGQLFPKASVIQIDVRAEAIGAMTHVDLGLIGDAEQAVRLLLDLMQSKPRSPGFRTPAMQDRLIGGKKREIVAYTSTDEHLDPRELVDVIGDNLPEDRTIVTDTGHSILFAAQRIAINDPRDRVWTSDFGAVGVGLAIAIGVAMARAPRTTVLFLGDGAFMMALHELDTAVRHRVGLTVVAMNNREFGSEVRHLVRMGEKPDLARFDSPNLADIADAIGCESATVRTRDDLEEATKRIGTTTVPLVIDARIDPEVVHPARG